MSDHILTIRGPTFREAADRFLIADAVFDICFFTIRREAGADAPASRLLVTPENFRSGKEGCARGTQEGCPAPLKS